ncbi:hypothetical protein [Nonomuraea sp. NPDC050540]|uniref:hypothetical protein n=1 Tax=Nonomuraea sp. NPDC050540 TaxID=3364367 RepID=UPI0037A6F27F
MNDVITRVMVAIRQVARRVQPDKPVADRGEFTLLLNGEASRQADIPMDRNVGQYQNCADDDTLRKDVLLNSGNGCAI